MKTAARIRLLPARPNFSMSGLLLREQPVGAEEQDHDHDRRCNAVVVGRYDDRRDARDDAEWNLGRGERAAQVIHDEEIANTD